MTWNTSTVMRRVRAAPEHLADLSNRLQEMARQVRASVAEAVGTAASGLVRDGLHRIWRNPPPAPVATRRSPSPDWSDDMEDWEDRYVDRYAAVPPTPSPSASRPLATSELSPSGLIALALQAAAWWLHRRGSWPTALALGLGVAGVAALGGPAAVAIFGVLEAAIEIAALDALLSEGGRMLVA